MKHSSNAQEMRQPMKYETELIAPCSATSKTSVTKKVFYRALRFLLLGSGVGILLATSVLTIILITLFKGVWSAIDRMLSALDRKMNC